MNQQELFNEQAKALTILSIAIMSGVVIFSGVSLLVHSSEGAFIATSSQTRNIIFGTMLFLAMIFIYLARFTFNKKVEGIRDSNTDLMQKLAAYRSATIFHHALCEVPATLGVVCFLLFGDYLFFIPVTMAILEMIRKFPGRANINERIGTAY